MRKRNTLADGCAAQAFAVEEHFKDEATVANIAIRAYSFDHFGERIALVGRLEVENAERGLEVRRELL